MKIFLSAVSAKLKTCHAALRALVLHDGFRLVEHDSKLPTPPQRAVVRGNQNILVQILGDHNRAGSRLGILCSRMQSCCNGYGACNPDTDFPGGTPWW